jgi:hypothetical protein
MYDFMKEKYTKKALHLPDAFVFYDQVCVFSFGIYSFLERTGLSLFIFGIFAKCCLFIPNYSEFKYDLSFGSSYC